MSSRELISIRPRREEDSDDNRAWRWESVGAFLLAWSSGLLVALGNPGLPFAWLNWIAFVPLLFAFRNRSIFSSFCLAWSAGFLANAITVHWVATSPEIKAVEFVLIAAYLSLHWGLFGAASSALCRHTSIPLAVVAPVFWVACEYLRSSWFPLELPWTLVGHSQYQHVALIQLAAVTGVYGVSFLIMMVNGVMVDAIQRTGHAALSVLVAMVIVGAALVFGQATLDSVSPLRTVPVTMVPGNVPQDIKWNPDHQAANFRLYVEATRRAVKAGATRLIIWPESSVPGPLNRDADTLLTLQNLAREGNASLLIGSASREKFGQGESHLTHRYNSAFLFTPHMSDVRMYHKIQLLPFGEYLPWQDVLPWPDRYRTHASGYVAGQEYKAFALSTDGESIPFSVLICWEGIFPNLVRRFVDRGAVFLVGMSNEAWFNGSSAPQFLAMNSFRAVENRRALVRVVNGGVSGVIDPYGRLVVSMTPKSADRGSGFLTYEVPVMHVRTIYSRYGDVFAQGIAVVAVALVLAPLRRRRLARIIYLPGLYTMKKQEI